MSNLYRPHSVVACVAAAIALMASPFAASAGQVGTPGPYTVTVMKARKFATPAADTMIECKPTATPGHFAGPLPAMMLIHGGAWSGGSNAIGPGYTGSVAAWCELWASWGFDAFAVGYRLTKVAPWPAQIVDVQAAIRWVRANASSLNVNPKMVVANGDSAGGQLAMVAGYSYATIPGDLASDNLNANPQPDLVISQFGPWTFGPYRPDGAPPVRALDYAQSLLLAGADGRTKVSTPPTLFVQGTRDTTVNQCSQSIPAHKFFQANRRPSYYLSFAAGHEFTGLNGPTWNPLVSSVQMRTISFAYDAAHAAGVLPESEVGPVLDYADDALPVGCP